MGSYLNFYIYPDSSSLFKQEWIYNGCLSSAATESQIQKHIMFLSSLIGSLTFYSVRSLFNKIKIPSCIFFVNFTYGHKLSSKMVFARNRLFSETFRSWNFFENKKTSSIEIWLNSLPARSKLAPRQ